MKKEKKNKKFKCTFCYSKYYCKSKKKYQEHMEKYHEHEMRMLMYCVLGYMRYVCELHRQKEEREKLI